jgi:hypothetical protein
MLYAGLIGASWAAAEGDFGSLGGVARLFDHPGLLLAGWVHYLAFDLLVGLWEREEAARVGLSRRALVPCLALMFLLGRSAGSCFWRPARSRCAARRRSGCLPRRNGPTSKTHPSRSRNHDCA